MTDFGLYIGTVGGCMWISEDGGQNWIRSRGDGPRGPRTVFSLTSQSADENALLAGTDRGIYRWRRDDHSWQHLPSPMDDTEVWSLVQSPHDRKVLLAGTRRAELFRSEDSGETWSRLAACLATKCDAVEVPRVTQILFDPRDPQMVWSSVEIDGVWRSDDGGRTFEKHVEGLHTEDVHGMAAAYRHSQRCLFATTNRGLFVSLDGGLTWHERQFDFPSKYTRSIVERADNSGLIFMTNGDGPPSYLGRLLKSGDYGQTWSNARLPGEPDSTPWCIAVHPACPDLVFTCTSLGLVYGSTDGGEMWTQLNCQFGEIRSMLLRPTRA